AIEGNADIGAHFADLGGKRLGRRRADITIDVEPVRFDADRDDLGAEFPKGRRRHLVAGAIGAIDDDAQAVEREIARQRALGEFDIAVVYAVDAAGAAKIGGTGETPRQVALDEGLDIRLDAV